MPAAAPTAPSTIRDRFARALAGQTITQPVYAVYDWFVRNRPIDWPALFDQGLGQINHADLVTLHRPNLQILETTQTIDGQRRRDVRWITDLGELHEWYLGEWRQEYLVKGHADYRILARAFEGSTFTLDPGPFERSEAALGDAGITLGQIGRTPLLEIQIDLAGLERSATDLADGRPELLDLLELMTEQKLDLARHAARGPARCIKLWENLSIETIGTSHYRRLLEPLYRRLLDVFSRAGKRLLVHYDGKLRAIADDIASLDFDIDSLTPAPEGDLHPADARRLWPDKFLWLHPPLGWFDLPEPRFLENVADLIKGAAPRRYCLMISEEVPPNWPRRVPLLLRHLAGRPV